MAYNESPIQQNFDVKQIIGHGATSTVRRAVSKQTGQQFAIKVYENQRMKAKNQIDMLIRLDHPNIVNIYDVYQEQSTIILVLEYMPGGQLYNMVGNKTKFSQQLVRQYMRALVDAVRYCHELQIVHRDIKPQNLLMSTKGPDAMLKLSDFGISKILTQQMLNTSCGTPVYMAPQIWQGKPYTDKVDIWSIGVVMYYLLAGSHPFDGDNQQLVFNIKQQHLTFSQQMVNSVSSKALNLIRQILNKNPQQRPSAKQIAGHIWLNHTDSIPKDPLLLQQVNLIRAVNKIRRFIVKQRLKKNNKMLDQLLRGSQKVSRRRMAFLLAQSSSSITTQQNQMLQQNYNMSELDLQLQEEIQQIIALKAQTQKGDKNIQEIKKE